MALSLIYPCSNISIENKSLWRDSPETNVVNLHKQARMDYDRVEALMNYTEASVVFSRYLVGLLTPFTGIETGK